MSDEQQTMYEVKVSGEFRKGSSRGQITLASFDETFQVPCKDLEALSMIQNRLLEPRLKSKHADYAGWRTCALVAQKELSADKAPKKLTVKDLPKMTLDEMIQFTANAKLKTDPATFGSVEEARRAIQKEIDDIKMAKTIKEQKAAATKKSGNKKAAKPAADAPETENEFADEE